MVSGKLKTGIGSEDAEDEQQFSSVLQLTQKMWHSYNISQVHSSVQYFMLNTNKENLFWSSFHAIIWDTFIPCFFLAVLFLYSIKQIDKTQITHMCSYFVGIY